MKYPKIFFCKKCGTLDYIKDQCPKCGSIEFDSADIEYLLFDSHMVQSFAMSGLWTHNHFIENDIEKIG